MKKFTHVFLFIFAFAVIQGCETKSEKGSAQDTNKEESVATNNASIDRSERLAIEKARLAELKRVKMEELRTNTPFYTTPTGVKVYNKVEQYPTFEGGENAMNKYLKSNLKYPEEAEKNGVEGTLYVDFIVTANGDVTEVYVTELPYEDIDQSFRDEAVRVISAMPKWVPGLQNGKKVDVLFNLPITFQLM